jgi:hypothetical protein
MGAEVEVGGLGADIHAALHDSICGPHPESCLEPGFWIAAAQRVIDRAPSVLRDQRNRGYREGRLAVWQELREYLMENEAVAAREVALSDGPLPTADEVRGILR